MSNYHPSYVDDVPVKISERYKPPPEISLPNKLVQCLHKCSKSDDSTSYDFGLEKKILCKTLEWKNIQIKEKNERQERIRLRDQERLRKIEAEHKQKLNQVSYPSTDDLNSMSDEENETTPQKIEPRIQKQQNFDSILVPTVILRDSPVTVSANPNGFKKTHQKKHSSGKIDYSYFENANSNPFDNMEMKTINDLDILAEIWKPKMTSDVSNLERDNSSESDSDKTVNNNSRMQEQPINYPVQSQPQQNYGNFYNYPGNFQAGQYNYYQQQQNYQQFYPNSNQSQTYAPQFTYPSNYQQNINNNTIISDNIVNKDVYNYASPYYQQMAQPKLEQEQISQSKSKSVPDIVKELNDELNNCEMRRVRNNSQTVQARKDDGESLCGIFSA